MNNLEDQIKLIVFEFLVKDKNVHEFEQWIYEKSTFIENALPGERYLDLISFNYNQKDAFKLLQDKLSSMIDIEEFNLWRTKRLLTEIIENKIDIVIATRKLRDLYFETGEKIIPITLGVGYESELDDVPIPSEYEMWDKDQLNEKLKKVDLYRDDIIRDAITLLKTLNT